jgi:hypothetical protein
VSDRYERLPINRRYALDTETGEVHRVGADDLGVERLKQSVRELGEAVRLVAGWYGGYLRHRLRRGGGA